MNERDAEARASLLLYLAELVFLRRRGAKNKEWEKLEDDALALVEEYELGTPEQQVWGAEERRVFGEPTLFCYRY